MRISDWSSDVCSSDLVLTGERARNCELGLELSCAPDVGLVTGDERRLKQAVYNLISNAIKFTPPGGRITVTATRQGAERPEERRGGNAWVSKSRYRGWPHTSKKKNNTLNTDNN